MFNIEEEITHFLNMNVFRPKFAACIAISVVKCMIRCMCTQANGGPLSFDY